MTLLVARNTIKLASDASSTDGYYVDRMIELTHVDLLGRKTTQRKRISGYTGSTKVATIDGIWAEGLHPQPGDTYKIVPKYGDGRVSINPAIQTLDYVTSNTYGRGLNAFTDLKLDSWLNSARICDTRSDIWVKTNSGTVTVGDVYVFNNASIWQGTVAEIDGVYIRFTDCLGKLTYKWNDWRNFALNRLVHQDDRLYLVSTAGVKSTMPTHTSGTTNGLTLLTSTSLTKVTGSGSANLGMVVDGNPIRYVKDGVLTTGYTLYDSDGVDYYRYLGWSVHEQREVTRHQTNISVDTSLPLFDNTNSMLQHFGGILRYEADKYVLEVEQPEGNISTSRDEPRNITSEDIIGRISITDEGIRNAYNSLTASYTDPGNKFEARNISFFNSEYMKADRNVPKKGSVTIPGITNYYNARMLADKYLTRSRFGLNINLNLAPRGSLLLPGSVIQLQYPRYGWTNKKFRIENLTHNDDCTVDISATEHDNSFYTVSGILKGPGIGLAGDPALTTISPPTNVVATNIDTGNELIGAIQIKWTDNPDALLGGVTTEIYASSSTAFELNGIGASGSTITTSAAHGLTPGMQVSMAAPRWSNLSGAVLAYYVKTTPTATTFTVSETLNGLPVTDFNDASANFGISLATIIGTVVPPTNTYTDSDIFSLTGTRVEKYYWLRYRID